MHKWGHMRLRALLNREPPFPEAFRQAPLAAQYSSLGSLDDAWLTGELRASLAAGRCGDGGGACRRHAAGPWWLVAARRRHGAAAALLLLLGMLAWLPEQSPLPPAPILAGQLGLPAQGSAGLQLVWTTVAEVQNSIEGWMAGRSIPGPAKNVDRPFLQAYYRRCVCVCVFSFRIMGRDSSLSLPSASTPACLARPQVGRRGVRAAARHASHQVVPAVPR